MKVLLQKIKSSQSSPRAQRGPHTRTHALWTILIASLILDPILRTWVTPRLPEEVAITLGTLCAISILPFIAQRSLHVTLSKLRNFHLRTLEGSTSILPLFVVGFVVLGVFLKLAILFNLPKAAAALALAVIVPPVIKQIKTIKADSVAERELLSKNPWAKVQRWEQQLIIFVALPLVLARLIGVCGAFIAPTTTDEWTPAIFTATSGLFLAILKPDRSFFMGMCQKCKHPVPIVFQDVGSCLHCDERLRLSYHAWVHGLLFDHSKAQKSEQPPKKAKGKRLQTTTKTESLKK